LLIIGTEALNLTIAVEELAQDSVAVAVVEERKVQHLSPPEQKQAT
jgi:hypothetical protein